MVRTLKCLLVLKKLIKAKLFNELEPIRFLYHFLKINGGGGASKIDF